jgi:hypothetical protein
MKRRNWIFAMIAIAAIGLTQLKIYPVSHFDTPGYGQIDWQFDWQSWGALVGLASGGIQILIWVANTVTWALSALCKAQPSVSHHSAKPPAK